MAYIALVIPVFNEDEVIGPVLGEVMKTCDRLGVDVVVVDDGSELRVESSELGDENLNILRHEVNCGVGAAIGTGMDYARGKGYDMVLTMDGDGQHDPADLEMMIKKCEQGVDIVNGSRFLKHQDVPLSRRLANVLGNILTFLLSGQWLSDSQSGMKAFSARALDQLEFFSAGYEWCTDVFREATWYDLSVEEVPISVEYSEYSMKKGQSFAVGTDMVLRLVIRSLMR